MKKTLAFLFLLGLIATALSNCGDDEGPAGPTTPGGATLPADVLTMLEQAFNTRDVGLFAACVGENAVFYFNQQDIGRNVNGYEIPASWTYAELRGAVGDMFLYAHSVALCINEYDPSSVSLDLIVQLAPGDGFRVRRGYWSFAYETYRGDDGELYWRIVRWWDHTFGGEGPLRSFGWVLAYYAAD